MSEHSSETNVTTLPRPNAFPPRYSAPGKSLADEIDALMGDAEPEMSPAPATPAVVWLPPTQAPQSSRRSDPPAGHPHGMLCPQCGEWIWRYSPNCRHCEVNLDQYRAELEAMRQQELQAAHRRQLEQQRQFWLKWASMLTFGGIGGMLLATRVSGALQGWLLWAGIASFLAGLALVRLAE